MYDVFSSYPVFAFMRIVLSFQKIHNKEDVYPSALSQVQ